MIKAYAILRRETKATRISVIFCGLWNQVPVHLNYHFLSANSNTLVLYCSGLRYEPLSPTPSDSLSPVRPRVSIKMTLSKSRPLSPPLQSNIVAPILFFQCVCLFVCVFIRETEISHLMVHSLNVCSNWAWTRPKPGEGNSVQISHTGGMGPKSHWLPPSHWL